MELCWKLHGKHMELCMQKRGLLKFINTRVFTLRSKKYNNIAVVGYITILCYTYTNQLVETVQAAAERRAKEGRCCCGSLHRGQGEEGWWATCEVCAAWVFDGTP